MDQGFNDDELADIMNEIESLEQEFSEETEKEVKAKAEDASHSEEEEVQPEPEQIQASTEIVEELSQKSEEHHEAHDDKNVHAIKPDHNKSNNKEWPSTSMDFSIEGDMKMNMFFKVSGKTVHLHVNEGAFEIELEGGMKFSIPVNEQSEKKAA